MKCPNFEFGRARLCRAQTRFPPRKSRLDRVSPYLEIDLMAVFQGVENSQAGQQKNRRQKHKAIASHALFISQWAQPLNAPGRKVIDQLWIRRGRTLKLFPNSIQQTQQVVLAHTQFVEVLGARAVPAGALNWF